MIITPYSKRFDYSNSLYSLNLITSSPTQLLISFKRSCNGIISLIKNTRVAFSTSPKPPVLLGTIPISCGGTRCAANTSSRLAFLMFKKSSLAIASDNGITCIPSFFPFGIYTNKFLKLPVPFVCLIKSARDNRNKKVR